MRPHPFFTLPPLKGPLTQMCARRSQDSANQPNAQLTRSLRDLYKSMGRTTEDFPPLSFLSVRPFSLPPPPFAHLRAPSLTLVSSRPPARPQMLRQVAPQFAERSRTTGQYAQQDAQEAWGAILQAAKQSALGGTSAGSEGAGNAVEQLMMGEFTKTCVRLSHPLCFSCAT